MNTVVALVTGGSGYLASHIIFQLLEEPNTTTIRATVRSMKDTAKIQHLMDRAAEKGKQIEWFQVSNLTDEDAFDEAVKGCTEVYHVASPYFYTAEDHERDIVEPAVKGAKSVLYSCVKHASDTVRRVVFTSSGTAVANFWNIKPDHVYTEEDWNTEANVKTSPYPYSKVMAERAVWEFVEKEKPSFSVTTICAGYILGPPVNYYKKKEDLNTSLKGFHAQLYKMVHEHAVTTQPSPGVIDVRDCARGHILAARSEKAANRRLVLSSTGSIWCIVLKKLQENAIQKLPKDHPLRQKLENLELKMEGDLERTKERTYKCSYEAFSECVPNFGERIPLEQTLLENAVWFEEHGFL
jgi:nucleoside-diphosphate-sugar epimerase